MRQKLAQTTLARVAVPTLLSTLVAYVYFDNLSLLIAADLENGTIRLVARDEAQFIQNFLTSMGLLFTILAGPPTPRSTDSRKTSTRRCTARCAARPLPSRPGVPVDRSGAHPQPGGR